MNMKNKTKARKYAKQKQDQNRTKMKEIKTNDQLKHKKLQTQNQIQQQPNKQQYVYPRYLIILTQFQRRSKIKKKKKKTTPTPRSHCTDSSLLLFQAAPPHLPTEFIFIVSRRTSLQRLLSFTAPSPLCPPPHPHALNNIRTDYLCPRVSEDPHLVDLSHIHSTTHHTTPLCSSDGGGGRWGRSSCDEFRHRVHPVSSPPPSPPFLLGCCCCERLFVIFCYCRTLFHFFFYLPHAHTRTHTKSTRKPSEVQPGDLLLRKSKDKSFSFDCGKCVRFHIFWEIFSSYLLASFFCSRHTMSMSIRKDRDVLFLDFFCFESPPPTHTPKPTFLCHRTAIPHATV